MKSLILILAIGWTTPNAHAITCRAVEGDGVPVTGATKKEATKDAWRACIARKIASREHLKGSVDEDAALTDAEACINAKVNCN